MILLLFHLAIGSKLINFDHPNEFYSYKGQTTKLYPSYSLQYLFNQKMQYFDQNQKIFKNVPFCKVKNMPLKYIMYKEVPIQKFENQESFIYKIQDIKKQNSLIDVIYADHFLLILFSNKTIKVYLQDNQQFSQYKQLQINISFSKLNYGQLHRYQYKLLLFINSQFAFSFSLQTFQIIIVQNYSQNPQYLYSTIANGTNYILVARGVKGLQVFSFNYISFNLEASFEEYYDNRSIEIVDIEASNSSKNLIYILDKTIGILFVTFDFNNPSIDSIHLTKTRINSANCQNFFINQHRYIVANCKNYKGSYIAQFFIEENTGKIVERKMEISHMNFKDLYVDPKLIIGRGDSYHLVLHSSTFFKYPENFMTLGIILFNKLQKIIYIEKLQKFLLFNSFQFIVTDIKQQLSYIECSPTKQDIGEHLFYMKYSGQCLQNATNQRCDYIEAIVFRVQFGIIISFGVQIGIIVGIMLLLISSGIVMLFYKNRHKLMTTKLKQIKYNELVNEKQTQHQRHQQSKQQKDDL